MSSYHQICPKCLLGYMVKVRYVVPNSETRPNQVTDLCLSSCPSTEHLHLRCDNCWYFEFKTTGAVPLDI